MPFISTVPEDYMRNTRSHAAYRRRVLIAILKELFVAVI